MLQLTLCYEKKGNLKQAQAELEQLTASHPDLMVPHRVLSRIYQREGKGDEAAKEMQRAAVLEAEHRKGAFLPRGNGPEAASPDESNQ